MANLGKFVKVDLREVWQDEAADFTPWLAENIKSLGDALGIDLEVLSREQSVGSYRADILCRDIDDKRVLIENQLNETNHKHLGQIMTYAAGLEAGTIIWIAEKFTEEHRAALDWLNEKTEEGINFFGLEIETWKIDGSLPASRFNIVCKPNEWTKNVKAAAINAEMSDTERSHLDYLNKFKEFLKDNRSFLQCGNPRENWMRFDLGRRGFILGVRLDARDNKLAVGLRIDGEDRDQYFSLLMNEYKDEIESLTQLPLEWYQPTCRLQTFIHGNLRDEGDWPRQYQQLKDTLETLHKVLSPIVKNLDASKYSPE